MARAHHQEFAGGKLPGMFLEYRIEVVDLDLQVRTWKPEKHDARVGEALVEDQLAEIAVGNQQNPLLLPGDGQDILISQAMSAIEPIGTARTSSRATRSGSACARSTNSKMPFAGPVRMPAEEIEGVESAEASEGDEGEPLEG